jgi:ABC-type transporter Mla MlaB component
MSSVAELKFDNENVARIINAGQGSRYGKNPNAEEYLAKMLAKASVKCIHIQSSNLDSWDSSSIIFLINMLNICESKNLAINSDEIPAGVSKLINLSETSPVRSMVTSQKDDYTFLDILGRSGVSFFEFSKTSSILLADQAWDLEVFSREKSKFAINNSL